MSLVTVSEKRDRVYPRRFDHEEAQRLRAEGWTYLDLAEHFGVSIAGVTRVCDPRARERLDRHSNDWLRKQREPCLGGCGALVWAHRKGRSGYCPACLGALRSSVNERPEELRCTKCEQWKPDDAFLVERGRTSRRGHKSCCRDCETALRQANRLANKERERHRDNARKRKEKQMSEFVVLCQNGKGLVEIGRVEAVSRLHAVEEVAQEPGEYMALKADMLKPFKVQPVTRLSVVRDDA